MAFQATLHQMIVFFLVLAIGFGAGKLNVIEKDYLPKFAKLITSILLPVMIFTLTRNGSTRQIGNTGFVGAPLLAALYPDGGLMYMGLFGLIDTAYFWTGGLFWATARDREFKVSPKIFLTPNVVAIVLAFAFGHEGDYAAGITVATLVASVATIPLVQFLVAL